VCLTLTRGNLVRLTVPYQHFGGGMFYLWVFSSERHASEVSELPKHEDLLNVVFMHSSVGWQLKLAFARYLLVEFWWQKE
jgi:hypothetical protein